MSAGPSLCSQRRNRNARRIDGLWHRSLAEISPIRCDERRRRDIFI